MNRNAACLIAVLSLAAVPAFAAPHSHDSHATVAYAETGGLTLNQGRKWATDEALRRHMGDIRGMLAQHRDAILAGKLSDDKARALGAHIEVKAAAIVNDCNLPPEADAQLHIIVADLVEAAGILQGKTGIRPQNGTAKAARATQMYATYFEHPGWKPAY